MSSASEPVTVLVVDDDRDQLAIRCLLLSHHGFNAKGAADVASALHIADVEQPEVAVVDLRLPTEDSGLSLLRELKRVLPQLHVIVFTGVNIESLIEKPELKMVDEFLQKGLSSGALFRTLERVTAVRVP